MKKHYPQIIAGVLVLGIIILLLLTGPVNAVILGLNILDNIVQKGETAEFTASIEVEAGENLEIDYLVLDLSGPISGSCLFNPDGTKITSCNGITIEVLETPPYNSGYGFSEGLLRFRIRLDTTNYPTGNYQTKLIMFEGSIKHEVMGIDLIITAQQAELESCSVRAEHGLLNVSGVILEDRTKLNFNVASKRAALRGQGSLTSQTSQRLSFTFNIIEVLQNNENNITLVVSGKYNFGAERGVNEIATIFLDKKNSKVSMIGQNIQAENMYVNFLKGC